MHATWPPLLGRSILAPTGLSPKSACRRLTALDSEQRLGRRRRYLHSNSASLARSTLSNSAIGKSTPGLMWRVVPEVQMPTASISPFMATGMALVMVCRLQWLLAANMATKSFLRREMGIL